MGEGTLEEWEAGLKGGQQAQGQEWVYFPHLTGLPEAKAARRDPCSGHQASGQPFSWLELLPVPYAILGGSCSARQQTEGKQMRLWEWASCGVQGESEESTPAEERGSRTGKLTEIYFTSTLPPPVINSPPQLEQSKWSVITNSEEE